MIRPPWITYKVEMKSEGLHVLLYERLLITAPTITSCAMLDVKSIWRHNICTAVKISRYLDQVHPRFGSHNQTLSCHQYVWANLFLYFQRTLIIKNALFLTEVPHSTIRPRWITYGVLIINFAEQHNVLRGKLLIIARLSNCALFDRLIKAAVTERHI